jgi:hypothetical protein
MIGATPKNREQINIHVCAIIVVRIIFFRPLAQQKGLIHCQPVVQRWVDLGLDHLPVQRE